MVMGNGFMVHAQYDQGADDALGRAIALSLGSQFAPMDEDAQLAIALAASVQEASPIEAGRARGPMDGRGFSSKTVGAVLSSAKAESDRTAAADGGPTPMSAPHNQPSLEELRMLRLRRFPVAPDLADRD
jgi:hypothetical protein